jgi:prepilin-type N-terminal cleavage/methylation domain-containing protein
MRLAPARNTQRAGFTFVELLLVIAIIALLAGLLTSAALRALITAKKVRNRTDLGQLETSIEALKQHYKVAYIPSLIKLSETGNYNLSNQLDADSVAFLTSVWPNINLSGGIDWNGDGVISTPANGGDYILEGDQCLVFFLGGIPGPFGSGTTPSVTGFSTNPSNPAWHIANGGDVTPPFYEFPSSRLVVVQLNKNSIVINTQNPPITRSTKHYSYLDTYGSSDGFGNLLSGQPYAFFSAYKTRNGYNRYGVSECPTLGLSSGPYFEVSGTPQKFLKPSTYQIISAGSDGQFGPGGGPWTSATASSCYPSGTAGYDDQTNFTGGTLGTGD